MKKGILFFVLLSFVMSCIMPPQGFAQALSAVGLMSEPGVSVVLSPVFTPAYLKGMVVDPKDPLKFDFIIHKGDTALMEDQKQIEYTRLIKYFLASLAVPDDEQWVNLSPYEQERIIPDSFGLTEMGRDLLAQDYLLKQISSSLTNPDTELGKQFWDRVYAQAHQKFGTTLVETDSFNKVWIVPDRAVIYEQGQMVYVLEQHLKVMLEEDYLATRENAPSARSGKESAGADLSRQVMQEIILPALEEEINQGRNFAPLRQVYSGMLLAAWYKRSLKGSFLGRVYADQGKVRGIDQDPAANLEIYSKYVEAFKRGVFNMIREDVDRFTQELLPRKYFAGGTEGVGKAWNVNPAMVQRVERAIAQNNFRDNSERLDRANAAMREPAQAVIPPKAGSPSLFDRARKRLLLLTASAVMAVFSFTTPLRATEQPDRDPVMSWITNNVFEDGMPRSYGVPKNLAEKVSFWNGIGASGIEPVMIDQGLNFYDGSAAVIATVLGRETSDFSLANRFINTLRSGSWGEVRDIRAWDPKYFRYGPDRKILKRDEAFFFRMSSPRHKTTDPLSGEQGVWQDWMPIMGENAWIMMAAVQTAHAKYNGNIPRNSEEIRLAESLIPAFRALTSQIGAIYHAPEGTFGKDPHDISNENNFSAYAALRMLHQATGDRQYKEMMEGIEGYFKKYGFDKEQGVLYQGGLYDGKAFRPNSVFSVDVSTWGILAFTPQKMDEMFGPGTSFRMWQKTKERAGHRDERGALLGVGYTDGHDVFSAEWTAGAVAACLELSLYYKESHPDWANEALKDAVSMLNGLESLSRLDEAGRKSYLYVNKAVFIPFGWHGRPIPSTASTAWVWYLHNFINPFVLEGKTRWGEILEYVNAVNPIKNVAVPGKDFSVPKTDAGKSDPIEQAMATPLDPQREVSRDLGGIDMNASVLDMQIRRDGNGVALPIEEQDLERIRIQGLVPVILFIQPAVNMPLFSDAGPPEPSQA